LGVYFKISYVPEMYRHRKLYSVVVYINFHEIAPIDKKVLGDEGGIVLRLKLHIPGGVYKAINSFHNCFPKLHYHLLVV